ncbi:MAG: hypothetical protein CEN88_385 [Candidatus Berkelbacteria bacterium Licking1014_2]|uniref:Lipopolysaccharide biosynthesis protein n=1 Tax=Candidatus Berkelbacteria bacterium Licking1014_2 TaxID=2017146 RepID=A0A554LTN7_9BACT|nr:MAG: hypothetical protein CEN88_385 [Candidatus Berkelbacteria bacterium Licking1014_2]
MKKEIILTLIITLLFAIGGWLYSSTRPVVHQTAVSFFVEQQAEPKTAGGNYYQYDSFYLKQAESLAADSIQSFFALPSEVKDIYKKAEVTLPDLSAKKMTTLIKANKPLLTTSSVAVVFSADNKQDSEKLANTAVSLVTEKFAKTGVIDISNAVSQTVAVPTNTAFNVVLAALAGLIFGAIIGFIIYYKKTNN